MLKRFLAYMLVSFTCFVAIVTIANYRTAPAAIEAPRRSAGRSSRPTATPEKEISAALEEPAQNEFIDGEEQEHPGSLFHLERDQWVRDPAYWKLVDSESGRAAGKFRNFDPNEIEPGRYDVVWRQSETKSSDVVIAKNIKVARGETKKLRVSTGVELSLPSWSAAPARWSLRDAATKKIIAEFQELLAYPAPAGDYEVVFESKRETDFQNVVATVSIQPGQVSRASVSTAVQLRPAPWLPKEFAGWSLMNPETLDFVARFAPGFTPELVAPGKYRLYFQLNGETATRSELGLVNVIEGRTNFIPIRTGARLVATFDDTPPYRLEFVRLNKSGREVSRVRLYHNFGPVPLKPGVYRVYVIREKGRTAKVSYRGSGGGFRGAAY